MRRIVDAFAEYERPVIKARTRAALGAKRRRRQRVGSVPLGFDLADDRERSKSGRPLALVANPVELATLEMIRRMRSGGTSLRGIVAELDRRGIEPNRGGTWWSHSAVVQILGRAELAEAGSSSEGPRAGSMGETQPSEVPA